MVWENQLTTIVMLTRCVEDGKVSNWHWHCVYTMLSELHVACHLNIQYAYHNATNKIDHERLETTVHHTLNWKIFLRTRGFLFKLISR